MLRAAETRERGALKPPTVVVVRSETSGAELDEVASGVAASGAVVAGDKNTGLDAGLIEAGAWLDAAGACDDATTAAGAVGGVGASVDDVGVGAVAALATIAVLATVAVVATVAVGATVGVLAAAAALVMLLARRAASRNRRAASAADSGTTSATTASARVAPTHTCSFGSAAGAVSVSSTRSPLARTTRGLSASLPGELAPLVIDAGRAPVGSPI